MVARVCVCMRGSVSQSVSQTVSLSICLSVCVTAWCAWVCLGREAKLWRLVAMAFTAAAEGWRVVVLALCRSPGPFPCCCQPSRCVSRKKHPHARAVLEVSKFANTKSLSPPHNYCFLQGPDHRGTKPHPTTFLCFACVSSSVYSQCSSPPFLLQLHLDVELITGHDGTGDAAAATRSVEVGHLPTSVRATITAITSPPAVPAAAPAPAQPTPPGS